MYHFNEPLIAILILACLMAASTCSGQYIQQLRPIPLQNPTQHQPPTPPANVQPSAAAQMIIATSNPYLKATDEILLNMRQQMVTRSLKFDQHFRDLLRDSKVSLHNMFTDTYGMMYQHNTDIFTSMYEELEQYYATGQIRLTQSMNRFFESLYQKIFGVFHSNRVFTPSFLKCATDQLTHLKPFKDIPEKLTDGVRHAFVAARTFVQALNSGVDVIKGIISVGQTAQCSYLINERLLRTAHLGNNINNNPLQVRQPCLGYCEQVMTRCFVKDQLTMLNQKWAAYVSALSELGTKLSTSYNIETIIAPLDVQISEAIMLFQENATNISEHVFLACGIKPNIRGEDPHSLNPLRQPSNRLGKRAASPGPAPAPVASRFNQNPVTHHNQGHKVPSSSNSGDFSLTEHLRDATRDLSAQGIPHPYLPAYLTTLGHKSPMLIDEIKNYMLSTRNFWSNLPNEVCTSNSTLGMNASLPQNRKQTNCFQDKFEGVDTKSFDITDIRHKTEFDKQLIHLDDMRVKIEAALAGREILWPSDSHPQVVAHPSLSNIISRPSSPALTTSTSTTPEPSQPDQEEDEDTICEGEDGSGDDCVPTEDDIEVTTDNPEYTDESDIPNEDSTSQSTSFPDVDQVKSTTEIPNNEIDKPQHPNIDDSHTNLITADNLAHSYKSGQTSTILVINKEAHLLLTALMTSIALLTVKNFHH